MSNKANSNDFKSMRDHQEGEFDKDEAALRASVESGVEFNDEDEIAELLGKAAGEELDLSTKKVLGGSSDGGSMLSTEKQRELTIELCMAMDRAASETKANTCTMVISSHVSKALAEMARSNDGAGARIVLSDLGMSDDDIRKMVEFMKSGGETRGEHPPVAPRKLDLGDIRDLYHKHNKTEGHERVAKMYGELGVELTSIMFDIDIASAEAGKVMAGMNAIGAIDRMAHGNVKQGISLNHPETGKSRLIMTDKLDSLMLIHAEEMLNDLLGRYTYALAEDEGPVICADDPSAVTTDPTLWRALVVTMMERFKSKLLMMNKNLNSVSTRAELRDSVYDDDPVFGTGEDADEAFEPSAELKAALDAVFKGDTPPEA